MPEKVAIPMKKEVYHKFMKIRRLTEILHDVKFKSMVDFLEWSIQKAVKDVVKEMPKERIQEAIARYFTYDENNNNSKSSTHL